MDAVWFVRGRQLFSQIRFWTAMVGYDPRERSINQRIYLIYLIFFFSLWGFAILALFADWVVQFLAFFHQEATITTSINLTLVILILDFIIHSYHYSKESPFVFSDEDSALICQTPVDRRKIALAWMLGEWFPMLLPFLVFAVVMRFGSIQMIETESFPWNLLPMIWVQAMQVASIIIPLHLGLTAFAYAIGAFRLRDDRDPKITRIVPFGVMAVSLLIGFTNNPGLKRMQQLVLSPLKSGFGEMDWLSGFFWTVMFGVIGVWVLYRVSSRLNLSRAAQESRLTSQSWILNFLRDSRTNQKIRLRKRLGAGRTMSRIPGREGVWAIFWRNQVSYLRTLTFSQFIAGVGIFGSGLVMMTDQSWGIQIGAIILWTVLISQLSSDRIRSNLEMWSLNRQLPLLYREMLILEISLPLLGMLCLNLLGFIVCSVSGYSPSWIILGLMPGIGFGVGLFSAADILRQCKGSDLLTGLTADVSALGVGLSMFYSLMVIVFAWWLIREAGMETVIVWMGIVVAAFSYGVSYLLLGLVEYFFKKI